MDSLIKTNSVKIKIGRSPREKPNFPLPIFMMRDGLRDNSTFQILENSKYNSASKYCSKTSKHNKKVSELK